MDLAIKLIVLLPLLAAAIAGLFCRIIGDRPAQIVTCAALLIAAALSIFVFVRIGFGPENGKLVVVKLFTWIDSGTFNVDWTLRVDTLTAVMFIVVTGVSSMVHVYSVGYMAHDTGIPRFMSYLSLFTFFMLMLVTADNFVQLFFGWEGVGLCSYLLIGFWYDRPSANAAAIKAFVVNRIGDFGFLLGIFAVFSIFGTTAIFAASVGMVQNDIKRVIAYSTCSQLGYMFFAAGVSAYSAAMLHLFTHAFFKALLFLAAGSVIHAMSGEQDMRKMGGIWRQVPVTYAVMWIGSLALAGIPYFSGYFSKDTILEAAWAADTAVGHYAYWMGLFAAFLTAFYSWRLLIMTFHGESRASHEVLHHVHESPKVMLAPLIFLALGAIFAGGVAEEFFVGDERGSFWGSSLLVLSDHDPLEAVHRIPAIISLLPLLAAAIGIGVAYLFYMYRPHWPALVAERLRPIYLFLLNKWYFDELYDRLFVQPAFALGRGLWKQGDGAVIDGVGPDGIAARTLELAVRAGRLQSGYVYHYAFAILIGAVIMVSWFLFQSVG